MLFSYAGHDRYGIDALGIYVEQLCIIAFGYCAEHLLRRFSRGELICHIGILRLEETNPAGAAASEHWPLIIFFVSKAFNELAAFLHDCKVSAEVGVEYIVYTELAQRAYQTFYRSEIAVNAQSFAPCCTNRRSDLNDSDFGWICYCVESFLYIAALAECANGAVSYTLTAKCAFRFSELSVERYVNSCAGTCSADVPYVAGLNLIANLDTAHTFYALGRIADEREVLRIRRCGYYFTVGKFNYA